MANSFSGNLVYIDTANSEVEGPFIIQGMTFTNNGGSAVTVALYARNDDGTSGNAGSGTDRLLSNISVPAGGVLNVSLFSPISAQKLIAGAGAAATAQWNVYVA